MKIFIPENNLANEASHMWHMIRKRPDCRCFWQKNDRPGIMKDKDSAHDYQYRINVKIKNNALRFDSQFFTTSSKHTVQSIKGLFREELERYHFEYDEDKDKCKVTGKGGSGVNDDLVITLGMALEFGPSILRDPRRLK
jgi:hypothetical protein